MKITQVAQHVDDLDRAVDFYSNLLELEVVARFDPPGIAFFVLGDTRLLLDQAAPRALIYFAVADVRTRIEELRASGVVIDTEPGVIFRHENSDLGPLGTEEWMAFVKDSEENLVGLVSQIAVAKE